VQVTAQDNDGQVSAAATALVIVSTVAGDSITIAGGSAAGQVSVTSSTIPTTSFSPTELVFVSGQAAADVFTVNFGQLPVSVFVSGAGLTGGDKLVANGVANTTTNIITKTPGAAKGQGTITWSDGSPTTVIETVNFVGVPKVTINANGTKKNYVKDPGSDTTINGGPGDNTIEITATSGNGLVINGGPTSNTYILDLGNLAGPVTISNANPGPAITWSSTARPATTPSPWPVTR
jgi:hypothetical protein